MTALIPYAILVLVIIVAIILAMGLINMMRAGDANTSNKLMQARVFLQFIAILLIVGALYFARPG